MIKTLALILTMCLTLNACDSLMGVTNDVHYLSKAEKKHEKTERKRHERLLLSNAEDYKKDAEHYKAQAEALAKKVNQLRDQRATLSGWCLSFMLTTAGAVSFIIWDKCCAAKDADTKTEVKAPPSVFNY